MFSLVRIRPMFEQEAPKWPWEYFTTLIRIRSGSDQEGEARFKYDQPPLDHFNLWWWKNMIFEDEKDRGPALLLIIYTSPRYVHHESRWLRCSMAEVEQCSTAGGSPALTCVSLSVPEYQWGNMTRCASSYWPQRALPKVGITCAYQSYPGWAGAPDRLPGRPGSIGTYWGGAGGTWGGPITCGWVGVPDPGTMTPDGLLDPAPGVLKRLRGS